METKYHDIEEPITLADMETILSPRGTRPVVRLDLTNHYFKHKFIKGCVKDLQVAHAMGGTLNNLEQLGAMILADSAGIEFERM